MPVKVQMSLKTKLFLIFFVMDLSVILLLGFVSYQSKKDALRRQTENSLSIMASELADKVDRYLANKYEDTRALALHYSLHGLKTTTSSQNVILSEYLKIYPYFDHISVINVADIRKPGNTGGKNYSNSWYLPALNGQVTSSDMYISPLTDKPTMSFAAPVYDKQGRLVSIITTNLKLQYIWEMLDAVAKENKASGRTGYAFLLNKEGLLIAHPNDQVLQPRPHRPADMMKMIHEMTSGKSGTAYYSSRKGVRKVAGFAPLKGFGDYKGHGWSVGVNENYSELQDPMNRLLKIYFMFFVITAFAAFVISRYLAEYVVKPVNELREGAAKIGAGDFALRIPHKHEDEIGELANSFNSMANALQERDQKINEYNDYLKDANYQLERTNDELVRLEKEKADFNAMITHDIKSPLSTILTYAEMIGDGALTGEEELHKAMSSVYASGKKILTLVDNYLVSSAIDAGKLKLNVQPVSVNELIEDSMTFFVPQAERKNVKISFLKGTGLTRIMADKVQLDRVIGNILGNALKYIPSGASVTVSTKAVEDGVEIAISDTGKGIPEKDVDTMFQKFRRSSATGKIEGMGLGLYIAKAVTEAHGGSISLTSRVGKGTTFTVRLPAMTRLSGPTS